MSDFPCPECGHDISIHRPHGCAQPEMILPDTFAVYCVCKVGRKELELMKRLAEQAAEIQQLKERVVELELRPTLTLTNRDDPFEEPDFRIPPKKTTHYWLIGTEWKDTIEATVEEIMDKYPRTNE